MKLISALVFVLSTSAAFAAAPAHLQLSGSAYFKSENSPTPTSMNLTLKKETADEIKYSGKITFVGKKKSYTYDMTIKSEAEDNETRGIVYMGGGRIELKGALSDFSTGSQLQLNMKQYQDGRETCRHPRGEDICTTWPDELIDQGVMEFIIP